MFSCILFLAHRCFILYRSWLLFVPLDYYCVFLHYLVSVFAQLVNIMQ